MKTVQSTRKKRTTGGIPTSDVSVQRVPLRQRGCLSRILELHVPKGSSVADVTYGKGVFWRKVARSRHKLHATDLQMGVDCRKLPTPAARWTAWSSIPLTWKGCFENRRTTWREPEPIGPSVNTTPMEKRPKEAPNGTTPSWICIFKRDRKPIACCENNGVLIVKCQDEVNRESAAIDPRGNHQRVRVARGSTPRTCLS